VHPGIPNARGQDQKQKVKRNRWKESQNLKFQLGSSTHLIQVPGTGHEQGKKLKVKRDRWKEHQKFNFQPRSSTHLIQVPGIGHEQGKKQKVKRNRWIEDQHFDFQLVTNTHLIQVPGIGHEQDPLSSKDSPNCDHATAWVMQLGPCEPSATIAVCQKGILAQLIQSCTCLLLLSI